MYKKWISLLLSLMLLLSLALSAAAEETDQEPQSKHITIVNLKSLEKLAENCRLDSYSRDLVVSLQADLDLTGRDFSGIPTFSGRFEGNGHTIRGLEIREDGSFQGFFRYLTDNAVVQDLHLEGTLEPGGSAAEVGGFAGENRGLISGCSFTGTVSGKEYVGGIAGINLVSGTIANCRVSGNAHGDHFVGGIAGKNSGVIRSCENKMVINDTPQQNQVELTDITLRSALETEAAATVTDVGGIAGISSGLIRDCVNLGRVGYPSMGYNIGGIAGTQSGTIVDCENKAEIYGRKEVGGIVGQMEPSSVMTFETDVLQILEGQLNDMVSTVNQASSNLQGAGSSIAGQLGNMYYYVNDAQNAVMSLIPTEENPGMPDADTIQAARNTIGSSMVGMSRTLDGMGAAAYSAIGAVSSNLHAMNGHINAMRNTIGNVSETLGGSLTDRSDEDTETDFTGKVVDCSNAGAIHADMNAGGITGAMALENDLDIQEDWAVMGENSLNFESELRAVVRNCENTASVTVKKQNAGGLVGLQSLGLVKDSRNFGPLEAEAADYVGGISGQSQGYIRGCHANCAITGTQWVGGIAGSAAIASDCVSLVKIQNTVEKTGAILGDREQNETEEENPIAGNFYLAVGEDLGAIDGISYEGQAQPLDEEGFFLMDLPDRFREAHVTFVFASGAEKRFTVDVGSSFPQHKFPALPTENGRHSYWEGLEEGDLNGIFFDLTFQQAFVRQTSVLESHDMREGRPLLLAQGLFEEDARVEVEQIQVQLPLGSRQILLEAWQFAASEPEHLERIRLHLPADTAPEDISLYLRDASGAWRLAEHHVFGSYVVADVALGDGAVALVETDDLTVLLIAGGALLLAALGGFLIYRKRKTAKA